MGNKLKIKGTATPKKSIILRAVIPALVLLLALLWGQGLNVNAVTGTVM